MAEEVLKWLELKRSLKRLVYLPQPFRVRFGAFTM
jgi:hypothetical protein